jgi:Caspase domain
MKSWAIIVGINNYPPLAEQIELHGAVADACDFADWALDPAGGEVPAERLYFWTYPWPVAPNGLLQAYLAGPQTPWDSVMQDWAVPDQTRPPTATEIATTIERVGRDARNQAREDGDAEIRRVYVFLAGHGVRAKNIERNEETCFLAGDYRPISGNMARGLVPCESLRKALLNNRFDEAILFTDCCRSQTARLTLIAQPVSDYAGDPIADWGIAFAAQDGQPAYETQTAPVRGAFSSALMEGLRTHRTGPANELHAEPLRDYVLANIGTFTTSGQVPNLTFRPDPVGPLIVSGQVAGAAPVPDGPLLDVSALPAGTGLVLNGGDDKPIAGVGPFLVAGLTLQLPPLPASLYLIQVTDGSGRFKMFRQPATETVCVP